MPQGPDEVGMLFHFTNENVEADGASQHDEDLPLVRPRLWDPEAHRFHNDLSLNVFSRSDH